nr:DNA-(apurinic or apyrimidinic site) lyase, chloroplastic-like [Ipomoea batatas]
MGFDFVIRNQEGSFVVDKGVPWNDLFQPKEVEAMGVKEALSWLKNLNVDKFYIKTDALLIFNALFASMISSFGLLIDDMKEK